MAKRKINILMVAAECSPFAKVGGLADVVGSLPKALLNKGYTVKIIMPFYKIIKIKKGKTKLYKKFNLKFNGRNETVEIYKTLLPNSKVEVFLLKNKTYFSKNGIYEKGSNSPNQKKFSFFSLATFYALPLLKFKPNIFHLHDWHTGLLVKLLAEDKKYINSKIIYTIHNLSVQGKWDKIAAKKILKKYFEIFNKQDLKNNTLNPMRLGIMYADLINTVSPTYAKEILTNKYSEGLKTELTKRKKDIFGILNGLDYDFFNPATDKLIYKNFDLKNISDKQINKQKLLKLLKLTTTTDKPLIGVVSRIYNQKGLDWVEKIIPQLVKKNAQIVILGTGDKTLEKKFIKHAKQHLDNVAVLIKFDIKLAQKIYAAADMFLIPSRFEPCGLTQMMSMRYGTVPIVRATGGLKDTVIPYKKNGKQINGNGFIFSKENSQALLDTIVKALKVYDNKNNWKKLRINCLKRDFSWNYSAQEYAKLYKKILDI